MQLVRERLQHSLSNDGIFSDAHCHLDLFENPAEAVEVSRKNRVGLIITSGGGEGSSVKVYALAKGIVYGVVGVDPGYSESGYSEIEQLEGIIKSNKNIIGIGEVGLDRSISDRVSMEMQRKAFMAQVEIAIKLEVPLVIHSRGMMAEIQNILKERGVRKAVFHFFEGDVEEAKKAEKEGYLVSIPPAMTSKRKRAVSAIDISSIAAETDSPVVGKTPADVVGVVSSIAAIKGIGTYDAAEIITKNIKDYFYI